MRGDGLTARIPTMAVVLVVVTAVAAAVMVAPTVADGPEHRPVAVKVAAAVPAPAAIVQASPLSSAPSAEQPGAGLTCRECGVVESVVALAPRARDDGVAYQMRIRMDDGSLRTVEQRGALATGSRVTVAGGAVRSVAGHPGPG